MKYTGRLAFEGYAIGDILVYSEENLSRQKRIGPRENEIDRFLRARESAIKSFDELYENTLKNVGEEQAALFQTYKLMAEDLDFEDLVRAAINNDGKTAEEATTDASSQLAETFSALDDEYMKQRATDALEVGKTIVSILSGVDRVLNISKPVVLICNDLAASMLMRFNRSMIKGLVLINGNENSHVAIFARTLEIPTLVSVKDDFILSPSLNDKKVIVDCVNGGLIIDPSEEQLEIYTKLKEDYDKEVAELKSFIGKPSVTKDGVKIKICANITSTMEVDSVIKHDGEGVGLFRSEFIYMASKGLPSEDFQFNYYREVLEEMKGKQVIIRTFDIGADKKVDYLDLPHEENPALGYRSIRICRDRRDMFITQLRALYRASSYGNLAIMVPMIISMDEVNFIKEIIKEVKEQLTKENISFNDKVPVGIMIETPAAATISDILAKNVDFFSIGTNDLSQYTLACDRLNPMLHKTFDKHHPAILRLIKYVTECAHKAGIPCGICGELGRDPKLLPFFAAIHLDEISCSSAYILKTRKELSKIDTTKVKVEDYLG